MKIYVIYCFLTLFIWDLPPAKDTSRQEAQAETGRKYEKTAKYAADTKASFITAPKKREKRWERRRGAKKRLKNKKIDYGGVLFSLLSSLAFFGLAFLIHLEVLPLLIFGINLLLHLLVVFVWTLSIKKQIRKGKNDINVNSSELWFDWGMGLILLSLLFIATSLFIFFNIIIAFHILGGVALFGALLILLDSPE